MKSTSENKNEFMKQNLMHQVDKIMKSCNEKSIKTRYRYYDATERFCGFLAEEYRLQKFRNVKPKHFVRYSDFMKTSGYSASYIKTDLSGIRFFVEKSGNQNVLPRNESLTLDKRQVGHLDRAWTREEIDAAINHAKSMGRMDICLAIKMASTYGMRIEEVCRCQVNQIKAAIENGELYIKGKNGQVRYQHLTSPRQRELAAELLKFAVQHRRSGTDKLLYDNIKGATQKEKASIQNWIVNHRGKFQDTSRATAARQKLAEKKAAENGVKLKTDTVTFHGLRHYFAQERFRYYQSSGCSPKAARINVSEELGHHREAVTRIYLSDKSEKQQKSY